jgi:putative transposase
MAISKLTFSSTDPGGSAELLISSGEPYNSLGNSSYVDWITNKTTTVRGYRSPFQVSHSPELARYHTVQLIGPVISEPFAMLVFRQNLAWEGGGFAMKKKRFSVEQMIGVLKQAQVGVPVAEVIRKAGISEQTFYRWKAKYAGLEVDQVRQIAQLQEENLQLKRLVADLTLDKTMLQDVLAKKWWSLRGVGRQ